MDTKLKDIRYSMVTKGIAVFLVWFCFISAVASGLYLLVNHHKIDSATYFDTTQFVNEYSEFVQSTIRVNILSKMKDGMVDPETAWFAEQKSTLEQSQNFGYYIKNNATGEVMTNINVADRVAFLKKQKSYVYIDEGKLLNGVIWHSSDSMASLYDSEYEIHTAILSPLKQGDIFYEQYTEYMSLKKNYPYFITGGIIALLLSIAAFVYLVWAAGRKEQEGEIVLSFVDRIYTDIHTIMVLIAAVLSLYLVSNVPGSGIWAGVLWVLSLLSIDLFIGLSYVLSMVRQIKNKQLIKNSLTYVIFDKVRDFAVLAFSGKLFKPWTIALLLGYGAVNGVLIAFFLLSIASGELFVFLFMSMILFGFNVVAAMFYVKALKSLAQIMEAANELAAGNLDYMIDSNHMSVAFQAMAVNLRNLQKGMKKAVSEAIKGERMKTELITNVSHDLKTPLTSIVNYVDLLKKMDLQSEEAAGYVHVLEDKSARLKQLIEDLIEASKATSGNLAVAAEKVDLQQLVLQAYGEYEEKIENAGLDIRTSVPEEKVYVNVDGKHMWRIVENLLCNALKYSMTNSRVYVNIDSDEQFGILTIKNISAFPLDISPEQLTERFVRGDASRTTEGSGLGLSIVQGLANIQGGKFKVEIDGDLFKATVAVPLWDGEVAEVSNSSQEA